MEVLPGLREHIQDRHYDKYNENVFSMERLFSIKKKKMNDSFIEYINSNNIKFNSNRFVKKLSEAIHMMTMTCCSCPTTTYLMNELIERATDKIWVWALKLKSLTVATVSYDFLLLLNDMLIFFG